jgi:hypothetical protein
MSHSNIPSEEDIARARAAMREQNRGLSEVCSRILKRFRQAGLHEAFVMYSPANDLYVAHLFYRRNDQIGEAEASGLASRIKEAVVEELVRVGRGDRCVAFHAQCQ